MRAFDTIMYKWRHLIENYFCKLKEFKRIAMRSCKTDTSFEAMIEVLKHNHNITEITLQIENTKCNTLNQHKH